MPSAIRSHTPSPTRTNITKFTNCRVVRNNDLIYEDLWISSRTGRILNGEEVFFKHKAAPDKVIDLGGRILAPGLIEVQLNGAFGFDFSVAPDDTAQYPKGLLRANKQLVKTGVTSFTPTVTSQRSDVYRKVLPYLAPSGSRRRAEDGAESLGAHVEGPFINTEMNGIHTKSVLQQPENGLEDLSSCYGAENLERDTIAYVTMAPELNGAINAIRDLKARGIRVSMGHTAATYEEAKLGVDAGATMITHLFNQCNPLHHRNPGMFGLLGQAPQPDSPKPYFGIIADGIHLHGSAVNIAWNAHPEGFILVTDAMSYLGLPDGTYDWTNGERITKNGIRLTLEGSTKIAGSSITLIDCVNNFIGWSGASIAQALGAVTTTPAKMLGVGNSKGSLEPGTDADLVVLEEIVSENGSPSLRVEQVWKFGECVHDSASSK
ncbi:hypothetical protein Vi05172_g1306 [Venturia inaequalis]|uniref:N-acetylglucosamine-6-phosphate deacetylase n=1 Tax=Venturia inaequalis TaxID=5025 RepID=A0A8H3YYY5_VENIN|nr:hypothetical protein EG327_007057 [Venturia inaequalis]RDI88771.1 hypothetical protein Vi05172_g1306 [Venturia inaequalis]